MEAHTGPTACIARALYALLLHARAEDPADRISAADLAAGAYNSFDVPAGTAGSCHVGALWGAAWHPGAGGCGRSPAELASRTHALARGQLRAGVHAACASPRAPAPSDCSD